MNFLDCELVGLLFFIYVSSALPEPIKFRPSFAEEDEIVEHASELGVAGSCKYPRRRDIATAKTIQKNRSMSRILYRAFSYAVFALVARKTLNYYICGSAK